MAGTARKRLGNSCILLIMISGMERFAYKGVASNLITYLTDVVKMSNSSAAKTVNSWCGFTSMVPLLIAPFADSYWDRYYTIVASSLVYVAGLVALTSTAIMSRASTDQANKTSSSSFLFWSLYLISLGQGGYNPSLQAFGADQLDSEEEELPTSEDDKKPNKKSLFFQWWYFGVCSGTVLGISVMSYIQDNFGWILGFAIPMISMVTSVVVFSCGSRIYTYKQRNDDYKPVVSILQVIKAAAWKLLNCKVKLPNENKVTELELQGKPLCLRNFGSNEGLNNEHPKSSVYKFENAKVILRLLPIWLMLLMFAVIFQQPSTFFTKQGMTMKRNIGSNFLIPPATLQSAIALSIVLLMPLYDKVLIPITKVLTCNEKGITVMQRMGIGIFTSVIALIIAAIVETRRLHISRKMEMLGSQSETVPLSIFWLLPQYILLGISDIFTVVGMQEFFYSEFPIKMRTMAFALYTSVFGVGSYLSAFLISTVETITSSNGNKSWFCDDMSEARLDKYYWFLAASSALSFLFFVIISSCYTSKRDLDLDSNESCK
ncbi:PREDICTED: protein NRT1/ PTR FAMILY 5.8-like [Fragaria vesca subsp. vesca]|uniref:protein NRT1/ PTR FAMILY 5.8-like n=1 Tax=Fragaria vesca subsp. vesca TaxID=101020 RepID=UPI0002C2F24C|nr:PREDICTED: protein NRT1/ PTR FAMILY 5.8-like [Fragaria vesca subsp. vesca]